MSVSMHVMSAGDGCRYLLAAVVAGDRNRPLTTPPLACYTEKGGPPGYWLRTEIVDPTSSPDA